MRNVQRWASSLAGYLLALAATVAATAVIAIFQDHLTIPNVSLLYIPAILLTAISFGTGPGLAAAVLAVLEYAYFLLPPPYSFAMVQSDDVQDILAFVIFIIVALFTGQLAARARRRAQAAQRRAMESEVLHELGQTLMRAEALPEVLARMTEQVVQVFGVERCTIYVPDGDRLVAAAEYPAGADTSARLPLAQKVYQTGALLSLPAGLDYLPLKTADRVLGIMEVGTASGSPPLGTEERRLLTSLVAQAALAIARQQAEAERQRLSVVQESDRLKSALLSAVSHDLRTPLASIKAAATALMLPDAAYTGSERAAMLRLIDQEADRLNRLVGNLLDLSRIEAGVLRPALDWYDIQEALDLFLPRVEHLLGDHPLLVQVDPGLPPVQIDLVRIEELLFNLIENAARYTPPATLIEIRAAPSPGGVAIAVVDHGGGIPPEQRDRLFQRFVRGRGHSDRDHGTGLGLAICRGIAEVHGGELRFEPTPGGGASFVLELPAAYEEREAQT